MAVSSNFKLKMKTICFKGYSTIKMFLLRLGFNHKKSPKPIWNGVLAYFVTTKVEKSNFYKDLEGVIEWKDTVKKRVNIKKKR